MTDVASYEESIDNKIIQYKNIESVQTIAANEITRTFKFIFNSFLEEKCSNENMKDIIF